MHIRKGKERQPAKIKALDHAARNHRTGEDKPLNSSAPADHEDCWLFASKHEYVLLRNILVIRAGESKHSAPEEPGIASKPRNGHNTSATGTGAREIFPS